MFSSQDPLRSGYIPYFNVKFLRGILLLIMGYICLICWFIAMFCFCVATGPSLDSEGLVAGSWIGLKMSFGTLKWETGDKAFAGALLLPNSGKLPKIGSSYQGSKVKQVNRALVPRELWSDLKKCSWFIWCEFGSIYNHRKSCEMLGAYEAQASLGSGILALNRALGSPRGLASPSGSIGFQ